MFPSSSDVRLSLWMDKVNVHWDRIMDGTYLSRWIYIPPSTQLENTSGLHRNIQRRNGIEEQINEDIRLTVMILLLFLSFCVVCIRYYQRRQYSVSHEYDNATHNL